MIGIPLLLLLAIPGEEPVKPKFPLGKETTYVNGPLDKDGYVDYAAALNERLGKGITPDKNATVLIWKAIGPRPDTPRPQGYDRIPPEFFKALGVEELPNEGDYFISLRYFLKEHVKLDASKWETIEDQSYRAARVPWAAKDYPHIADWLAANEKSLAVVIEATKRPAYFNPITPRRTGTGRGLILEEFYCGPMVCRQLANALTARAMLRVDEGRLDDAWNDLLACHRLSRLVGHCGTLMEELIAMAIEGLALKGDVAYVGRVSLTTSQIRERLKILQSLPPIPTVGDKIDLGERFVFLEGLQMIRTHGPAMIEVWAGGKLPDKPDEKAISAMATVDWEPALRDGNKWYDRLAAVGRLSDRTCRQRELNLIEDDLRTLKKGAMEPAKAIKLIGVVTGTSIQAKTAGKVIGDVMAALSVPTCTKIYFAYDRWQQMQCNVQIAYALAAYRSDNGHYPTKLDDLSPKYLAAIPGDLFSGKPLIYRPSADGYLLYSVGPNGVDDGGRGYDDEPPGDDLVVNIPLPELKAKKP
jgi:hypothetical protein